MLFDLKKEGYFYTRLQNPTNDAVASKIAQLEGGVAAVLTSSGQAANFFAVFNICEAGDHIVSSNSIYGGTYNLFGVTMKKLGIDVTFINPDDSDEKISAAFRPNTKVLFGEVLSNPGMDVLDIEKFAKIAHNHEACKQLLSSASKRSCPSLLCKRTRRSKMLKYYNYDIVCQEIPDEVTLAINITGCPNHCQGCHSPWLWKDTGEPLTEESMHTIIDKYASSVTCICFMGGDQEPEKIEQLAKFVHSTCDG